MAISEITAGLSGIKTAFDIVKGIKDARGPASNSSDIASLHSALVDAQMGMIAASQVHAAQIDRIRELEEKMRGFETWDAEKQRYELKDLGWGAFAYMLKPDARGTEPPHWACANCYKKGEIAILQLVHPARGGSQEWTCPSCQNRINPSTHTIAWIG